MEINWDESPDLATHCIDGSFTFWSKDTEYTWEFNEWVKNANQWSLEKYTKKGIFEIIERPTDKWQEGEERMDNIAQNGNDGHYSEKPKPDVIEHGNNNKYSRKIKTIVIDGIDHDIYVDVYDVLTAFKTTNPANDHAIKKQLATGQRGVKGVIQDLTEARDSLNRAIELEKAKS